MFHMAANTHSGHNLKAYSHQVKAKKDNIKIGRDSKTQKKSNITEKFTFCVRFRLEWTAL